MMVSAEPAAPGPVLAMFDMDRTLLSKETASLYVRHQRRIGEASTLDLLRTLLWVAQYTVGTLDMERVARRALRPLLGTPEAKLARTCESWFHSDVHALLTSGGIRAVHEHQTRGDVCAIVTGASAYASRPLARMLGIEHLVSTEFEVDGAGLFTGEPIAPLCLGEGKLARARALAARVGLPLEEGVFYSDSHSDEPLLAAVRTPVAVNPDRRLRAIAKRRGWRIESWY